MSRQQMMAISFTALALTGLCGCATHRFELGTPGERLARLDAVLPPVEAGDLPSPLTPSAAVSRALDVSLEIAELEAAVRIAEHETGGLGNIRDPELRAGLADGDTDGSSSSMGGRRLAGAVPGDQPTPESQQFANSSSTRGTRNAWQVGLRVFPPNPWAMSAGVSRARASLYAAEAALSAASVQLAQDVRQAFAELQYADRDIRLLSGLMDVRRDLVRDMKALVKQGQGTVLESSRASYRYLQSVSDHQKRLRDRDALRSQLAKMLAVSPAVLAILSDEPLPVVANADGADVDALIEEAMASRADLIELAWKARTAREAYREERAQRIPWFSHLQASYTHRENDATSESYDSEWDLYDLSSTIQTDSSSSTSGLEEWEVSAGLTLPVFSWLGRADDALEESWRAAEQSEARAVSKMKQAVAQAVADLALQEERNASFNSETAEIVSELRSAIDQAGETGFLSPDELVRMREQLIGIERFRIDAEHQRALTLLDLEKAAGLTPLPASE